MTAPARILIVDDEPQMRRLLRAAMKHSGYRTLTAETAKEALSCVREHKPDLVLIDLDLPDARGDGAGDEVITTLREWTQKPIIVISARDREEEKVRLLEELGVDDYVTKPFGTNELMARIRVALRHEALSLAGSARSKPVLLVGDLRINLDERVVAVNNREVHLTPHEYDLLVYLMKHAGKVVTHPQILKEIWGSAADAHRASLRVYVAQLRRKLEAKPSQPRYLLTEPGIGYRLKES